MNNEKNSGNFWIGLFVGGLIGAIAALFMGTKDGKKMIAQLLEKGEEMEEDLEEKIEKLGEKGEELLAEAQEVKEKAMEQVEEKKGVLGETMVDKMDQALSRIEDIQQKGIAATTEIHHRYFKKNGKPLS